MLRVNLIANVIFIGFVLILIIGSGGDFEAIDYLVAAIFICVPALNIATVLRMNDSPLGSSWVFLWLKRKALEENAKIEQLSSN